VRSLRAPRAYLTGSLLSGTTPVGSKPASRAYPDRISSLGNHSGPLETRFPSVPDAISSLGVHSGPLETRFASRAACAALVAAGPASLETCVSIEPPRDPMPVADASTRTVDPTSKVLSIPSIDLFVRRPSD
jgi:hypothetical protein